MFCAYLRQLVSTSSPINSHNTCYKEIFLRDLVSSRQCFVELASQWFNTISRQLGRKMPDSYLGVSSDLMQRSHAYFLCAAGRNIRKVSKCKGTWKG